MENFGRTKYEVYRRNVNTQQTCQATNAPHAYCNPKKPSEAQFEFPGIFLKLSKNFHLQTSPASQVGITVSGYNLKNAIVDCQQGHIKGATWIWKMIDEFFCAMIPSGKKGMNKGDIDTDKCGILQFLPCEIDFS